MICTPLYMSEMDGVQTLRELLAHDPGAKVLMLTGVSGEQAANMARVSMAIGARLALFKPLAPGLLVVAVRDLLAQP